MNAPGKILAGDGDDAFRASVVGASAAHSDELDSRLASRLAALRETYIADTRLDAIDPERAAIIRGGLEPYVDRKLALTNGERPQDISENQTSTATGALDAEADGQPQEGEVAAPSEQGPADEQRGETVTLESALAEIAACELVADVNNRVTALLPLLNDDHADAVRSAGVARVGELGGE